MGIGEQSCRKRDGEVGRDRRVLGRERDRGEVKMRDGGEEI